MPIKITSDSTCDLSKTLLKKHDITIVPLYVTMGERTGRDGVNVKSSDLFSYVDKTGKLPYTSAVNVADYQACFAEFSPKYDAVIHITISSDFSSCYQNACLAAEEFPNVYVVDSRNLSTGHGHVVMEAALAAERGMPAIAIVSFLQELTGRVETTFIVDRVDYLAKGGRCSSVAALGANLLKLKPCIEVRDGKMSMVKKYRGSLEKVMPEYVRERLEGRNDLCLDRIFVTHSPCPKGSVEAMIRAIPQYAPFREIIETTTGSTVSCHCGPGTFGVLVIRKR